MAEQSLNEIMNDMAHGLDKLVICSASKERELPQTLSEFDAFLELDETLLILNKEYLNEKNQHAHLVKTFGRDDAMAEIAEDMVDSAWCAMQTRYLEMRQDAKMMEQAQRMMREAEQEYEEAQEKAALEKSIEQGERLIAVARYIEKMKEINKDSGDYLLAAVVFLFGLLRFGDTFFHFRSSFNRYGVTT